MKINLKVFLFSILLGVFLILADVIVARSLLYQVRLDIPIVGGISANTMVMYFIILITFLFFGYITSRQIYHCRQLQKQQAETVVFMEQLLASLPVPVFYKDHDLVYRGCNNSFEEFLGRSVNDIIGRTVHQIAPVDLADVYHKKDLELMDNPGVQIYESQVERKNGEIQNVVFHKATFTHGDGSLAGMIGVILDITELRMAERAREEVISDLRQAIDQVRVLRGFLPICSSCKKIRDDSGYWKRLETYIRENSEADFSHSICPDCSDKLFQEYQHGADHHVS